MPVWDESHDALVDHRKEMESTQPGYGLVKLDESSSLLDKVHKGGMYFYSSLPNGTFKEKMVIARYMTSKENDIEKLLTPNFINVKDFILSKATFTDHEGKPIVTPKLVLVSEDGHSMSVLAKVFITEFLSLCQGIGLPPWEESVCVSAKLMKGNGSNRYYGLHLP
jgi:hypothetical protein